MHCTSRAQASTSSSLPSSPVSLARKNSKRGARSQDRAPHLTAPLLPSQSRSDIMKVNRRELLKNAAFVSGAALVGASWPSSEKLFGQDVLLDLPNLPSPANSGIEHVVVVTMENRSFDHFLGWLPNADGKQAGLTYVDRAGVSHTTYSLSADYTACPHPDPDHSYDDARVEYDNGLMDGFLRAGRNDVYY